MHNEPRCKSSLDYTMSELEQHNTSVLNHKFIPDNIVQQSAESVLTETLTEEKGSHEISKHDSPPIYKLPVELLEQIFSYLSFDDFINVKDITPHWEDFCQDSVLWNKLTYIFICQDKDNVKHVTKILKNFSCLKSIHGYVDDECLLFDILTCILIHVVDLRKMNIRSDKSISPYFISRFVNKFPNLENITLQYHTGHTPDTFIQSIEYLSHCKNLKEMELSLFDLESDSVPEVTQRVSQLIGDGFPALTKLYIPFGMFTENAILYILQNKGHQLRSISNISSASVSSNAFDAIGNCTALKELYAHIDDCGHVIDFSKLKSLKSLHLRFCSGESTVYKNMFLPLRKGVWANIISLHLSVFIGDSLCKFSLGVVELIVSNLYNLESLVKVDNVSTINDQLRNTCRLSKLTTLTLQGYDWLTSRGIEYVFKCQSLRKLFLNQCDSLTDLTLEYVKNIPEIDTLSVSYANFNVHKILPSLLAMKYLRHLHLLYCKINKDEAFLLDKMKNHQSIADIHVIN